MANTVIVPILRYSLDGKFEKEYPRIISVEDDNEEVEYVASEVGRVTKNGTHKYKNKLWFRKIEGEVIKQQLLPEEMEPIMPVKAETKVEGLGDAIKSVTEFLGIKQCDACKQRQATLNRLFPFTKSKEVEPLSERELFILDDMEKSRILQAEYANELFEAYNKRFVINKANYIKVCQCAGIISKMKESLDLLRKD
jgi:hypothetical protein